MQNFGRFFSVDIPAESVPVGVAGSFTLTGNTFGMDFNPATGLLGVVCDLGQNIQLDPFNATLVAAQTTLYGVDFNRGSLVRQGGITGAPSLPAGS